ncbi:MAG: hypothetical protein ABI862_11680 [Ilumatobacteraceae bacterium]
MSRVDDVAERDKWRCWLCDEPVDPQMSVNDPRGASVDAIVTKAQAKTIRNNSKDQPVERLAHRGCNTRKGAITAVVPWGENLFVVDPAPIIDTVDMLQRKGGRVVMARCPSDRDGEAAAEWLVDRVSRLAPGLSVRATVEPGGGQFVLVLSA